MSKNRMLTYHYSAKFNANGRKIRASDRNDNNDGEITPWDAEDIGIWCVWPTIPTSRGE
jgi:hypothetical protein